MTKVVGTRSLRKESDIEKVLDSTREYYRVWSDEYVGFYSNWLRGEGPFSDPEYKLGYDKVAQILAELAERTQSIIDIGCGVGTWSTLMARSGADVISLDQSTDAILLCGKRSLELKVETTVSRIVGDAFNIPFSKNIFDGATLNWVLAHIPVAWSRQFVDEVGRVLKGGAWLMISDSYWRDQKGGKEQVQSRATNKGILDVYKYYYTPLELQDLLKDSFEVLQLETTPYEMLCIARKHKNR